MTCTMGHFSPISCDTSIVLLMLPCIRKVGGHLYFTAQAIQSLANAVQILQKQDMNVRADESCRHQTARGNLELFSSAVCCITRKKHKIPFL